MKQRKKNHEGNVRYNDREYLLGKSDLGESDLILKRNIQYSIWL